MKILFCLIILSMSSYVVAAIDIEKIQNCHSTKEYVTSFRYLEDKKAFSLKKNDIMKVADGVSKGCSGAAKRFIEITDLLVKAEVETSEAIKIGMEFSAKNEQMTDTFITIFKETFLKEYLDLNIASAIDFSRKLSLEKDGNPKMIKNDFQKIVRFCLDQKSLDLSGPKCSDLASRVAVSGTKFNIEMAPIFLEHYDFLTAKEGINLSTYKALEISLKLIGGGPLSAENLKDAYKFATSKSGLDQGVEAAINYAELMALRSTLEISSK